MSFHHLADFVSKEMSAYMQAQTYNYYDSTSSPLFSSQARSSSASSIMGVPSTDSESSFMSECGAPHQVCPVCGEITTPNEEVEDLRIARSNSNLIYAIFQLSSYTQI